MMTKLNTPQIIWIIIKLCWLACKIICQVMWRGHVKYDGADPFEQWTVQEHLEHAKIHSLKAYNGHPSTGKKYTTIEYALSVTVDGLKHDRWVWLHHAFNTIVRLLLAIMQDKKENKDAITINEKRFR